MGSLIVQSGCIHTGVFPEIVALFPLNDLFQAVVTPLMTSNKSSRPLVVVTDFQTGVSLRQKYGFFEALSLVCLRGLLRSSLFQALVGVALHQKL
jgi:hypothetical protein